MNKLFKRLDELNISLYLEGESLKFKCENKQSVTGEISKYLSRNKEAIVDYLKQPRSMQANIVSEFKEVSVKAIADVYPDGLIEWLEASNNDVWKTLKAYKEQIDSFHFVCTDKELRGYCDLVIEWQIVWEGVAKNYAMLQDFNQKYIKLGLLQ